MRYEIKEDQKTRPPFSKRPRPRIVPPPPSYKPAEGSANFILVKIAPGFLKKSLKELKKIHGISGFHPVYGEYDLVLIVREKDEIDRQALLGIIRGITGIVDVQALIAAAS